MDFMRGAALAERGKPIIALPATARGGTVSRLVPTLTTGAGVTTTRAHVHYVVTEYGVADLHGKSLRERARALDRPGRPPVPGGAGARRPRPLPGLSEAGPRGRVARPRRPASTRLERLIWPILRAPAPATGASLARRAEPHFRAVDGGPDTRCVGRLRILPGVGLPACAVLCAVQGGGGPPRPTPDRLSCSR